MLLHWYSYQLGVRPSAHSADIQHGKFCWVLYAPPLSHPHWVPPDLLPLHAPASLLTPQPGARMSERCLSPCKQCYTCPASKRAKQTVSMVTKALWLQKGLLFASPAAASAQGQTHFYMSCCKHSTSSLVPQAFSKRIPNTLHKFSSTSEYQPLHLLVLCSWVLKVARLSVFCSSGPHVCYSSVTCSYNLECSKCVCKMVSTCFRELHRSEQAAWQSRSKAHFSGEGDCCQLEGKEKRHLREEK